jgi:MYXO-CTERM domain-containing protein
MRITILVAAAMIAAPAAAQNTYDANTAAPAPADNAAVVDTNAVADPANGVAPAADPAATTAAPAPVTPLPADAAADDDDDRGFPWGAIGLIGLVGLLGRRRSRD